MLKWKRLWMEVDGQRRLVYLADEKDWAQWSIDRVPHLKSQKYFRYQVKKNGDEIGKPVSRLRDAKELVERQGREEDTGDLVVAKLGVKISPGGDVSPCDSVVSYVYQDVGLMPGEEFARPDQELLARVRDGLKKL